MPRRSMTGPIASWLRGIGQVVLVLGVLACAAAQAIPAVLHLGGEQLLIVVSGSMTPTFRAGDVVLVQHPEPGELRPGMVVSFHAPGSPQKLTTHRIHSLRPMRYGLFLQTKGDANRTPDPDFTPASSVVGVMGAHIPHVGRWLSLVQSPLGKLLLLGAPLLLVLVGQGRALWRTYGDGRLLSSGAASAVLAGLIVTGTAFVPGTHALFSASASVGANTFRTTSFCASASTYASTIGADAPYAYYRLGETGVTTTAVDASATPRNGTYQNTPTLGQPGAIKCDANKAVSFDGVTQYVSTSTAINNPTTFTLEVWFRTTVGGGKIMGFGNAATGSSTSYDRHVYLTDSGQVVFGVNPGAVKVVVSPQTYLDDAWHMVDATLGPTGMRLYVDGALVASDATTTTAQNYTGYLRIGYDNLAGWGATTPTRYHFSGLLDEIAAYPTALSAASIAAHYAADHS